MEFTVFGKPEGKARARVVKGHAYTPDNTAAYEAAVRVAFMANCSESVKRYGPLPSKPIRIEILAFYAVPKSASKRAQERMRNNELRPVIRPAWDNIGKVICDALNGVAWHDDSQSVEANVVKRYGITPMVCVKIEEVQDETA